MGHQYYKIMCIHGEKDLCKDSNGTLYFLRPDAFEYITVQTKNGDTKKKRILRNDIDFEEYSKCGHSFYTQILEKSLDTEYISEVLYKEFNLKEIHPKKIKDSTETFLGYSDVFINVKLTKKSRETLYNDDGFYCNGKKYVRYRRSASSAKSGNCLFVYESIKDVLDKWNYCGLQKPTDTSDLTSWEAYTALTLSGIQAAFQLDRKSILIIRDLKSKFNTPAIAVTKETTDAGEEILSSEYSDSVEIENTIWDGEALIDETVFSELESIGFSDSHMLLLRNRFFKSCGFRTILQDQYDKDGNLIRTGWFTDNGITKVSELNGYTSAKRIEDIKIVITESSLKYLKFREKSPKETNYRSKQEFWEDYYTYLKKNLQSWFSGLGNSHKITFGIVKSDKPSKFFNGEMVHTNYQLLNTLGLNEGESQILLEDTLDYLEKAKNDPAFFRFYLKNGLTLTFTDNDAEANSSYFDSESSESISQNYEEDESLLDTDSIKPSIFDSYNYQKIAVQKMLNFSDKAFNTPLCKYVSSKLMEDAKKQISKGRFLIPGTYATLFGNPIELLCSIIDKSYTVPDHPCDVIINGITYPVLQSNEIYCSLFKDGEELCCARSPHITMGNLFLGKNNYLHNDKSESIIDKYFSLSPQIVCVNSINHNLLERLNGADFDSDIMLISNHCILVNAVQRQEDFFPVPHLVKNDMVDEDKNIQNVSAMNNDQWKDLENIDNILSNNIVGQIVHCSQELNSILWTRFPDICRTDNDTYNRFEKSYNKACDVINAYLATFTGISLPKDTNDTAILVDSIKKCFSTKELIIFESTLQAPLIEYVEVQLAILRNSYSEYLTSSDTEKARTSWEISRNSFRINLCAFIFMQMYSKKYIERYNYIHFENEIYNDICILEVLSNLEIDKAKRIYIKDTKAAFNIVNEIKLLYQLEQKDQHFVLPAMPDYLTNLKKQVIPSKTAQRKVMGINIAKDSEKATHLTTLQYIYTIAMQDISRAESKKTVPLSSLLNSISGTKHHTDDFDRIKLIAAYYYLKIRTCHNISDSGKATPDYGKCAYYVQECFKEIRNKVVNNKSFNPSFMIFSLLSEIDAHQNERDVKLNTLTIESMLEQISNWGESHKQNLAHTSDFLDLISSIKEANDQRTSPKKTVLTETYARLLQAALWNIIDENIEIQQELFPSSTRTVKNVRFNENGSFSIYGHKCSLE